MGTFDLRGLPSLVTRASPRAAGANSTLYLHATSNTPSFTNSASFLFRLSINPCRIFLFTLGAALALGGVDEAVLVCSVERSTDRSVGVEPRTRTACLAANCSGVDC